MTPIEIGVSRSKVKVTMTFKFRGACMFSQTFHVIGGNSMVLLGCFLFPEIILRFNMFL